MNKEEALKLDNQLCFALYSCSREITKLYRPHLDPLGLTYTQYITLLVLWETNVISIKELCSRLYLDSGTLTPLLKKLEGMGFITRHRDPEDERSVIISLTTEGAALKEKAAEIPYKIFCSSGLDINEAVSLKTQLKMLIERINL